VAGEFTQVYASWRVYSLRQELSELAWRAWGWGFAGDGGVPREGIGSVFACGDGAVVDARVYRPGMERVAIRALLRASRARGRNTRSLAIAGAGDLARRVTERLLAPMRSACGRSAISMTCCGRNETAAGSDLAVKGNLEALVRLAREVAWTMSISRSRR